jgi:hypothetical protein
MAGSSGLAGSVTLGDGVIIGGSASIKTIPLLATELCRCGLWCDW